MNLLKDLINNEWSCGFGSWTGKPKFDIGRFYYDGWQYYLHIGSFWVCCASLNTEQAKDE